jgi:hypothetical protein
LFVPVARFDWLALVFQQGQHLACWVVQKAHAPLKARLDDLLAALRFALAAASWQVSRSPSNGTRFVVRV